MLLKAFKKYYGNKNFNDNYRVLVVTANNETILNTRYAPKDIKNKANFVKLRLKNKFRTKENFDFKVNQITSKKIKKLFKIFQQKKSEILLRLILDTILASNIALLVSFFNCLPFVIFLFTLANTNQYLGKAMF